MCNHFAEEYGAGCFTLLVFICLVTVSVLRVFLTVPCVILLCLNVVFPCHTHLLFKIKLQIYMPSERCVCTSISSYGGFGVQSFLFKMLMCETTWHIYSSSILASEKNESAEFSFFNHEIPICKKFVQM